MLHGRLAICSSRLFSSNHPDVIRRTEELSGDALTLNLTNIHLPKIQNTCTRALAKNRGEPQTGLHFLLQLMTENMDFVSTLDTIHEGDDGNME